MLYLYTFSSRRGGIPVYLVLTDPGDTCPIWCYTWFFFSEIFFGRPKAGHRGVRGTESPRENFAFLHVKKHIFLMFPYISLIKNIFFLTQNFRSFLPIRKKWLKGAVPPQKTVFLSKNGEKKFRPKKKIFFWACYTCYTCILVLTLPGSIPICAP